MNEGELKPCPFCACEIVEGGSSDHKTGCFMTFVTDTADTCTMEELRAAWDRRPEDYE